MTNTHPSVFTHSQGLVDVNPCRLTTDFRATQISFGKLALALPWSRRNLLSASSSTSPTGGRMSTVGKFPPCCRPPGTISRPSLELHVQQSSSFPDHDRVGIILICLKVASLVASGFRHASQIFNKFLTCASFIVT